MGCGDRFDEIYEDLEEPEDWILLDSFIGCMLRWIKVGKNLDDVVEDQKRRSPKYYSRIIDRAKELILEAWEVKPEI